MIAEPATKQQIDFTRVRADLADLFVDGQPRELMAVTTGRGLLSAIVGTVRDAVRIIEAHDRATIAGWYCGVNPLDLPLRSLSPQRPGGSNVPTLTALLLDFDVRYGDKPKRAATDEEMALTVRCRDRVHSQLVTNYGFPVEAMRSGTTGNGSMLLYRLPDLPNNSENLKPIADATRAVAAMVDAEFPGVKLDTSVTDAVRVRRIDGTVNRRADHPQRLCDLEIVTDAEAVSLDALKDLAAQAKQEPPGTSSRTGEIALTDEEIEAIVDGLKPAWHEGNRHNASRAASGFLWHLGADLDTAAVIVARLSVKDLDPDDRRKCLQDTYARGERGETVAWHDDLKAEVSEIQFGRVRRLKRDIHAAHTPTLIAGGSRNEPKPPPVPAFPRGIFPDAIEAYIVAGARSIGVPAEMIAAPLLVAARATIGKGAEIVLKRGFRQLPTLWAGIIAPPGTAKSPSFQVAQWPIHHLQGDAYLQFRREQAEHDAAMSRWEAKPKPERGAKPVPPALEHLYSTDPTIEALVEMLQRCRGVAILRDELSGLIGSFDKYRAGKGSDRQEYLSLWACAPIKADRKGGGTVYAVHPVGGICGGIQPDILRGLNLMNGARDGFIERFLLCVPDVEASGWTDDDLDPNLLAPVVEIFQALRGLPPPDGAERISVQLSTGARQAWIDWYNDNAAATRQATGLRRGFYSKMPNQVARIALVLHCMHNAGDPRPMVADATMQDAIAVGEFFRAHLDRVLPLIGDTSRGEPVGLAGRILRILRMPEVQDADGWVRRDVLYNRLRNVAATTLSDELTRLTDHNRAERRIVETGTKPSEQWRIFVDPGTHNSDFSDYPPSNEHNAGENTNNQNVRTPSVSEPTGDPEGWIDV